MYATVKAAGRIEKKEKKQKKQQTKGKQTLKANEHP